MIKLLITDLDDTLYPWLGFFIPAFDAMADKVADILKTDKCRILAEYKEVHRLKENVEHPYATMLLPAVQESFEGCTEETVYRCLRPAFRRFDSVRDEKLHLFSGVKETLTHLREKGVSIVGYTESAEEHGFYRLRRLGIADLFTKVYVAGSSFERPAYMPSSEKTEIITEEKPNPGLLRRIMHEQGVSAEETVYAGDSLTRDIYMAHMAGVRSVQCRYPKDEAEVKAQYDILVDITNWTEKDFRREEQLRKRCRDENVEPDHVISSFSDILDVIDDNDREDREKGFE